MLCYPYRIRTLPNVMLHWPLPYVILIVTVYYCMYNVLSYVVLAQSNRNFFCLIYFEQMLVELRSADIRRDCGAGCHYGYDRNHFGRRCRNESSRSFAHNGQEEICECIVCEIFTRVHKKSLKHPIPTRLCIRTFSIPIAFAKMQIRKKQKPLKE